MRIFNRHEPIKKNLNVGDRVKIVNLAYANNTYRIGDEGTVSRIIDVTERTKHILVTMDSTRYDNVIRKDTNTFIALPSELAVFRSYKYESIKKIRKYNL